MNSSGQGSSPSPEQVDYLLRLIAWYRDAGVDAVVSDTSVDWRARGDKPPTSAADLVGARDVQSAQPTGSGAASGAPSARQPRPPPLSRPSANTQEPPPRPGFGTPQPPDAATQSAREAATGAGSLAELRTELERFDGCGLKATAKSLCFFRGAEQARVMVIGEAPGRDEDRAGIPFVGRAGQLLDKMLAAIGLDETHVHITNVVYWRPPGNRTPTPVEVQVCRPFLERQIALVAPEIVVTVGGPAAKALLETSTGIMKLRGSWRDGEAGGHAFRIMPTLHPAYLLRTPAAKRLAWRDLLAIKAALEAS
jgi:uracil-DNA glycosylase